MTEENVCYASSSPAKALFWTTLAFFGGFAGVSAFGPVVSRLKDAMDLSPALMALLAACPALTGSLLRIPFGAMVDRIGGKRPALILLALAALGVAGITALFLTVDQLSSAHYPFFLFFGVLCGCGIAVFSVGIPSVSYWYPQKDQGSALAVYAGLGNLAPGLFAMILPFLVTRIGFTGAYVLWLVLLLLLVGSIFAFMKDAPYFQYREMGIDIDPKALLLSCGEELVPSGTAMQSIRKAGGDPRTWMLTGCYFVSFGGFIALTVWLPSFWSEHFGKSLLAAGLLTALYSLSASLLRVGGGYVSDRLGGENTALMGFLVVGLGGLCMAAFPSAGAALAGEMLLALGMGVANAAVFKLVPKYSPAAVGGAAGIVGGLGAFGGFVIPPIMGLFVKTLGSGGYAAGFWVFVALAAVAAGLVQSLRRRMPTSA
jgi:NNP family nitrate/nitrite transporter-like MFS transporter